MSPSWTIRHHTRLACAGLLVALLGLVVTLSVHYASAPPSPPAVSAVAAQTNNITHILLLMGQSNMVGFGVGREYAFAGDDRTFVTCAAQCTYANPPGDVTVYPTRHGFGLDGDHFGPELGVAERWRATTDDGRLLMVKIAWGGLPIAEFLPGGRVHPIVNETLSLVRRRHADARVAALLWMQGETDALRFDTASRYEARFRQLRESLGDLPVVSGLITSRWPFHSPVRAALRNVSTAVVETDDLTLVDGVHYDTASNVVLGRRFVDTLFQSSMSTT